MHEMGITVSVVEAVRERMEREGASTIKEVRLRVGKLTALEPLALSFCFDAVSRGTPLEGARLLIEEVAVRGRCRGCATEFVMEGYLLEPCPRCGGANILRLSGTELEIVSIDVE